MEVKSISEFNKIINDEKLTVVDFFANWCGPCKMLTPVFASVENDYSNKANFIKLDIDQLNEIPSQYDVQSIPTIIFFKNGNEVGRNVGFMDSDTLIEKINTYMNSK
ncbi:MAG: thioredoxin [Ureaplasma sp.]|nr:thioredoxin [Ureaplasma sp.]